ncbi:MAG: hypothetical protein R3C18_26215 [Planctomycetaceae bacterium]
MDAAADVILRNEQNQERLESEATELFGHEDYIREEMHRVRKLGRYITEESLIAILETYFEQHHPQIRIAREADHVFAFRVTDALRRDIHAANAGGAMWINSGDESEILRITTSGEAAFRNKELELLNANHPLIKAATEAIWKQMDEPTARIGAGRITLDAQEDQEIDEGSYTIAVFAHEIASIRSRRILEPVAWHLEFKSLVPASIAERLLFLAVKLGVEVDFPSTLSPLSQEGWDHILDAISASNSSLRISEERENQARYVRRRRAIDAEYKHKLQAKQQRYLTAEANAQTEILPAMRGQIDKAKAEYQKRLDDLENAKAVSARLTTPLAICLLQVEKAEGKYV